MSRLVLNMLVIASSLCLVISGLSLWLGAAPALAQGQPPRPTLTPVPPTPVRDSDRSSPTAVPAGRITGTVIDQTTGAPAPNIAVAVGDQTVVTDANGNYDRSGLPAGDYVVALALAAEQGVPSQAPIIVPLASGATVVQHLAFRSPVLAAPTPIPTAVVVPAALPITGGADGGSGGTLGIGIALLGLGFGLWSRQARATR
jgi:Carboxypeptidase regulatory-like domain